MDYLLKSSTVIILFYACYKLFLQRETFFTGNRWFLLIGLLISALVPLIVIPIYVLNNPVISESLIPATSSILNTTSVTNTQEETTFELMSLLPIIYVIGVVFFLGKLVSEFISLILLIKRNPSLRNGSYTHVETDNDLAPFSFFNWIVYNAKQFDENELQLILKHEKVHVKQLHSIDVIISQLACALLWFNPIIWFYKEALQQNLEFIADQEAQFVAPCEKSYQTLLLKTSFSNLQLSLTNNFYNSLIKKRIIMLHKSKSNKMNAYKYTFVLPLLALFVSNFNTEIIAQTTTPQTEVVKIGQNVLKYVITKDTKDKQLETIKEKMTEQDVTIEFKNLKRNDKKEIISIRIEYTSKKGSGEFFVNSDEPIKDIAITHNVNENTLTVGQAMKNLSQSFEIISDDNGGQKVKTSGSGNNVFVYSTDDDDNDEKVIVVGKDGDNHEVKTEKNVYVFKSGTTKTSANDDDVIFVKKNKKDTVWIKEDVKNIVWTDTDGKDVEIIAVEKGNKNTKIFTSGDNQPLVFLDGVEIPSSEMSNIKTGKILSVDVLKGDAATKKHGSKGNNGVIYITLKDDASLNGANQTIAIGDKTIGTKKDINSKYDSNSWSIKTEVTSISSQDDIDSLKSYFITKNTIDKMLESHKQHLKSEGVTFNYSKLKRNKEGIIVRIKVELSNGTGKSKTATFTNDDGISQISIGIKDGNLFLNSSDN